MADTKLRQPFHQRQGGIERKVLVKIEMGKGARCCHGWPRLWPGMAHAQAGLPASFMPGRAGKAEEHTL